MVTKNNNDFLRLPFIPEMSRYFTHMEYFILKSEEIMTKVSRGIFLRALAQQTCPMGQIYIDFEAGTAYIMQYKPERVEGFIKAYHAFEAEYKAFQREQEEIRNGIRQTVVHLDQLRKEMGDGYVELLSKALVSEETPESLYLEQERADCHRATFDSLKEKDRILLISFRDANGNYSELARRLGKKDPSGTRKLVKRAAERLAKKFENTDAEMSKFGSEMSEKD